MSGSTAFLDEYLARAGTTPSATEVLDQYLAQSSAKELQTPIAPEEQQSIALIPRAIAQLTADPAARLRFLQQEFGAENVAQLPTGQIQARTPEGIRVLDPERFELADFADIIGETLSAVAGTGGAIGGGALGTLAGPGAATAAGAVGGAAVGSAGARAATEAAFEYLSGEDVSVFRKAMEEGAASLAGSAFFGVGGKAVGLLGRAAKSGLQRLFGRGPQQRLQNSLQQVLQNADEVANISAENPIALRVARGQKVADSVETAMANMQGAIAEGPGAAINAAVARAGDNPVVSLEPAIARLRGIIQRERGAANRGNVNKLQRLLDDLTNNPSRALGSVRDLQSQASKASVGKGKIAGLGGDPASQRIAGEIADSLVSSLDEAVRGGALPKQIAADYAAARLQYGAMQQKRKEFLSSLSRRILRLKQDVNVDQIPRVVLSPAHGEGQALALAKTLRAGDRNSLEALQVGVLDHIFEAAKRRGGDAMALNREIRNAGGKLAAIFGETPADARAVQKIIDLAGSLKGASVDQAAPDYVKLMQWAASKTGALGDVLNPAGMKTILASPAARKALENALQEEVTTGSLKFSTLRPLIQQFSTIGALTGAREL